MEEEDVEDSSPFWVQSSRNRHQGRRFRHGLSSFFFSSGLLITLLMVTAVAFLVFVVPSTISFSSQIFRPNNVKKSWDSLNLVLVLFALVFGFLSRNKNEDRNFDEHSYRAASPNTTNATPKSNPSTPQGWYNNYSSTEAENSNQWVGYSDHTAYHISNNNIGGGLKRTSSSYPDLLEATSTLTSGADPWLCYDDIRINTSRFSDGQLHRRRSWKYTFDDPQNESKRLYEDEFVNSPKQSSSVTPAPPAPPTPPPAQPSPSPASPPLPSVSPPLDHEKPMRVYRSVEHKKERRRKRRDNQSEHKQPIPEPVITPPTPPLLEYVDQKSGKSDKKRSWGNATKDFLNSSYHKKKKNQRQKSVENIDALFHKAQTSPLKFQEPPPPVFQTLLSSKKSKRKTTETVISVPVPPLEAAVFLRPNTSQTARAATQKPQQPVKVRSFDSDEGNSNSGGESPLIPIPPPPPPPPSFVKSTAWKFVLQGDFVRLDSNLSSRSGSPDPDEVEFDGTPTATDGGDMTLFPASPLFCLSPDVNAKAENFIGKFRDGLKLEKINSMNKRGVGNFCYSSFSECVVVFSFDREVYQIKNSICWFN